MNEDESNYNYAALLYQRHVEREESRREQIRHTWVFDGKNEPFRYSYAPVNDLEKRLADRLYVEPPRFTPISG